MTRFLRWLSFGICILGALATCPPVYWWLWAIMEHLIEAPKIDAYKLGESSIDAIQIPMGVSTALFQTALVLIAAIWGTVFLKSDEAGIALSKWDEQLMLVAGTLTLVWSGIAHVVFSTKISFLAMAATESERVPDITHRSVSSPFIAQYVALIAGAVMLALTVMSATWLKQEKEE